MAISKDNNLVCYVKEDDIKTIEEGNLDDEMFNCAKNLQKADVVVMAAPFWDLSFPAILKIYIENCAVEGITFKTTSEGLKGLCKASQLIYFTSRGGIYNNSPLEQATPYLKAICNLFGINEFICIDADGMDIVGYDATLSLNKAIDKAKELAKK